jgi:type II secretory ATPase GspE/PulE/Tfp pilus assembly ATPase PilB-like protein
MFTRNSVWSTIKRIMSFLRKKTTESKGALAGVATAAPVLTPVAQGVEVEELSAQPSTGGHAAKVKIETELARGAAMSVIAVVTSLLDHAREAGASDIHIDPRQKELLVRFRVDGVMQEMYRLPKVAASEFISRIKVLASLRTDEHQAAQDGRFRVGEGEAAMDVRVSIVPTYHGENAVLRLLANQSANFSLDKLGFSEHNKKKILQAMQRPYGMVLATGPTGSGKTTTLYTLIRMLNAPEVSIVTIEDPIEYAIEGIEQIQANPRTGLTFANGLRSILRQDPNIIMVGEIRDAETAGIAVNTALTGHLVFSTLHTNDAATTLPRMLDMKIETYLIASTVNAAIGQRLVRKICEMCKTEKVLTAAERKSLSEVVPEVQLEKAKVCFFGKGCEECNGTGFRGRVGIHEVLVPDAAMREAVLSKAPASELKRLAIAGGMVPMIEDGFAKVQAGLTTIEEVLRMLYE